MKFFRNIKIAFSAALVITMIFSVVSFAETSEDISHRILRLHVIANSDSDEDQCLKLSVRDRVLEYCADIFDGSVNIENAVDRIAPKLDMIKDEAESFIKDNGYDYRVNVSLSEEYFTTRTYENVTLPAGRYLALRIIIGEGAGHNWWCVMFPPMCLPAAEKRDELGAVLTADEINLVEKNPRYEMRFKIVEIYEEIKNRINKG